ncbi:acetyltransferase [Actinoplanes sp. CA-030573]|uniref:acetyltransferase n=1 Tax=Actinoplanes sp. CA-030573 TaxID=3239898 RepID=UPI003D8C5B23
MNDLVIVGAGGFARETAAAAGLAWRVTGFLDDNPALHGTTRSGVPILGPVSMVHDLPEAAVVVCVGNPRNYTARRQIVERLALPAERYATVLHPTVSIGAGSVVGPGSVLLAGTVLTADVTVGAHVAVMPQAVLTHDDVVGDYATVASGVRLGGGAVLETGAYVGAGALVREGVTVGAWSLVGMGSVVLTDVPSEEIWVGSPARKLRSADLTASLRS